MRDVIRRDYCLPCYELFAVWAARIPGLREDTVDQSLEDESCRNCCEEVQTWDDYPDYWVAAMEERIVIDPESDDDDNCFSDPLWYLCKDCAPNVDFGGIEIPNR